MPQLAVLSGPQGVGKFYGASLLAEKHAPSTNVLLCQHMTAEDARFLVEWTSWLSSSPKIAVLEPGDCYEGVWTTIKNVMESLPDGHHVWVSGCGKHPVPPAVRSLSFQYSFSLLNENDLRQCFSDAGVITQDEEYLATLGSMDEAMRMNSALCVNPSVSSWIEAVEQKHRGLLLTATQGWGSRNTTMLAAEIEKQLGHKSIIDGTRFRRVDRDRLLKALTYLHDTPDPYLGAVAAGLILMSGR